jgi:hypothetical protein
MKREFSRRFFEKYPNIKFNKKPSSGSWKNGRKDMKKPTVAFRNFANALKMKIDLSFDQN